MFCFKENYIFLRFQRGVQHFLGGGGGGWGGGEGGLKLISIETFSICGFQGGSGPTF